MRRIVPSVALLAALVAGVACFERGGKVSRDDARVATATPIDAGTVALSRAVEPRGEPALEATIRLSVQAEPAHLNPFIASDAVTARIAMGDIYQGLLCTAGAASPATDCLARGERNANDRTWTFQLRRDVRWHDGKPFTAADVVFTYRLFKNPKVATWLAADFDDLISVRALGAHRVVFRFKRSRIGRRLAFAGVPILPRHRFARRVSRLTGAHENRTPIGTGPLRFVRWQRGKQIELARNQSYWGTKPRVARVIYRVIATRQRALAAFGAGELDVLVQVPIDEALRAQSTAGVQLFSYRLPAYFAAVHNHRHAQLSDARVRRGLTMMLDRSGIARRVFAGFTEPITGPFLPGTGAYDPAVEAPVFDPKAGARLIATATSGQRVSARIMIPQGSRTMARIADIWAADAKPHADLQIVTVPFADMLGRLRGGRFDVALMGFTTHRQVDLYTRFHSSQVGISNYGGLRDTQLDQLLESARRATTVEQRNQVQRQVHKRLNELQTYSFIGSDSRVGLVRAGVGGVTGESAGFRASELWRVE